MVKERQYLTAIQIERGIIILIEPNGELGYYRQRGIHKLSSNIVIGKIASGELAADWERYKELPVNYSISYEDTEIMGRARASFKA